MPPGTRLAEFELRSVLGVGGFGIVYEAFDHSLERPVAIKEYLPAALAGRNGTAVVVHSHSHEETFALGLKSFVNEARLLARFDHPSLLKVWRFWEANGTAYMVMPVLRGRNLKDVRREMTQPPDEAWLRTLLDALLGAVQTLHRENVFHRDIAPDNIQIDADGRPVLMDFGAARHVVSDATQSLTVILKPSYAPIEQYAEVGQVKQGPWTDLYALGATLHYLLLQRPPAPATARAVHDEPSALTPQALPGYDEGFLRILDWMLAPRPGDRPQSVAALREVLEGGAAVPAPAPAVNPAAPRAADPFEQLAGADADADADVDARTIIKPAVAPAPEVTAMPLAPTGARPTAAAPGSESRAGWLRSVLARLSPPRPPAQAIESTQLFAPPAAAASTAAGVPADHTVFIQPQRAAGRAPGALRAALTVQRSDVQSYVNRVYPLADGQTLIGRGASAQVSLPDHSWSAQHARIVQSADGFELFDLDSRNGTWVNGIQLVAGQPCRLYLGASIQLGATVLALSLLDATILPDLCGRTIAGRYVLKECLQASPKGVVYRAEKKDSGVAVAIKILSPDYAGYPGYRERFAAEAQIASRLQHPHICRLDDFGETEIEHGDGASRVPYSTHVIMGGGSLANRHREFGRLPLATVQAWLAQAADALDYAHGCDVVHGNLKPSTICFDAQSNLYLTDFAIAGPGARGPALIGTPAYMAPEQWASEQPSAATDQYALAAIAYTVLTGLTPYEGQEDPDRREHNLAAPPPALHAVVARRFKLTLPAALSPVVNKALSEHPADRHESVGAFVRQLAQAARPGRAVVARPVFLSYRREDSKHLAMIIEERLKQQHGIASFMDTQGLDAAGRFPERIAQAIRDCQVFVCILGPTTLSSGYVLREIALAHELGKAMIPVFQETDPPPLHDDLAPEVKDLLVHEGIPMSDGRPRYLHTAIAELAERVQGTLADRQRDD